MNNPEFLAKVSRMQKEFAELYGGSGLVGISSDYFHIEATLFRELEKENLLEHISKTLNKKKESVDLCGHDSGRSQGHSP